MLQVVAIDDSGHVDQTDSSRIDADAEWPVEQVRPFLKTRVSQVDGLPRALLVEATMWRLTKAIIISWLVGVVCGVGLVIVSQREDRMSPASSASNQTAPQSKAIAPDSPDGITR
jgi:hypothetical protein